MRYSWLFIINNLPSASHSKHYIQVSYTKMKKKLIEGNNKIYRIAALPHAN